MSRINKKLKRVCVDLDMPECENFSQILRDETLQDDIKNVVFTGCQVNSEDYRDYSFEDIIFHKCSFSATSLSHCSFTNVLFDNCNFPNCDFSDSWFNQVEFVNTNLKGANFTRSRVISARIESCNMKYANFTSCSLEVCEIEDSDASDSFFAQCSLSNMALARTKFVGTEFFQTPLKGIDFSTCDFRAISISQEGKELAGAIVNLFQAAELSKILGVIIKEDD